MVFTLLHPHSEVGVLTLGLRGETFLSLSTTQEGVGRESAPLSLWASEHIPTSSKGGLGFFLFVFIFVLYSFPLFAVGLDLCLKGSSL